MSPGLTNGIKTDVTRTPDLPLSPSAAAFAGLNSDDRSISPVVSLRPAQVASIANTESESAQSSRSKVYLELKDGRVFEGVSFGAPKSAAGELVFQTGMVGYPESITDPSYRGQILVITFPLVGNYGVPSREDKDELLGGLEKHFESTDVHIAGLIVSSYCGEEFSHHLATSSLGAWLKERDVPAMYGVDTRSLTKLIRKEGSLLARMLHETMNQEEGESNQAGIKMTNSYGSNGMTWRDHVNYIDWRDQNQINLVAEGEHLYLESDVQLNFN